MLSVPQSTLSPDFSLLLKTDFECLFVIWVSVCPLTYSPTRFAALPPPPKQMNLAMPLLLLLIFISFIYFIISRQSIIDGLKTNWEELHHQYQGLSVVTDTAPKKARKESLEAQMKQLERDIETMEKHKVIYIAS